MNNELTANIAVLAAFEAAELMAKKAGVSAATIIETVLADPEGNTAKYFKGLVSAAIREVPTLVA